MADIQKTIEIVFGAVDNTGGAMSSVAGGIDSFVGKVSGVTAPLAGLGNTLLQTEAAIVSMGAAMLAVSVNEAAKFQEATLGIGTLFNATGEQAGAFGTQIQDFAAQSTQSMTSITDAVKVAIGTGVEQAKSLELVAAAEKLAVAGGAELSATTLGLVSSLNAYGLSTDEAQRFSDVFFQTVNLGNVSVEQLSTMLANVTPIASAAGVPIETLGSAIALLTANGTPAGQAIDGIRDVISNIIKPSSQAADEAARLGIQFDAAALKSRGLDGVLRDVMEATGGNVGQMSLLFGNVQGLAAALALGANDGAKFNDFLGQMQNSAGATDKAFELMSESVSLQLQNLQNNLKNTLIDAGKPLLESFGGTLGGLSDVFKALRFSIDQGAFQPIYDALNTASSGLKTYLEGIAKALPEALGKVDFGNLIGAFGTLGNAIKGLFGGLDLTKPEELARALQFAANGVASLTKLVAGMVESFGPAVEAFIKFADKANASSGDVLELAGNVVGASQQFEFFKGVLEVSANVVLLAAGGMNLLGGSIKAVGTFLEAGLLFRLGQFIGLLAQGGLVTAAGAAGYAVGTVLNDGIGKLLSAITGSETTLGGWIYDLTHGGEEAEKFGTKTGGAADGVNKLATAQKDAKGATEEGTAAIEKAASAADGFVAQTVRIVDAQGNVKEKTFQTREEMEKYISQMGVVKGETDKVATATQNAVAKQSDWVKTLNADGTYTYSQNLNKAATGATNLATATDKAKTATEAAAKAQAEWDKKLLEMNFQERMQAIKSATEVTVASIQAESDKAVAAFESIGQAVSSTNDLIGKLFGQDAPDWDSFGFNIQQAATDANRRANELTAAQIKLIEAQIQAQQIKNDLMRQGMPEIVIQADGLEPHIEAFMFQILNKIQVKASQLGAEWLVGGGMVAA